MLIRLITLVLLVLITACNSINTIIENAKLPNTYEGAAQKYSRLAVNATGQTKSGYLLSAAENLLTAKNFDAAEQALNAALQATPDLAVTENVRLLTAQLAQARNHPYKVLINLEGLPQPATSLTKRIQITELRAWAFLARNQGVAAAQALAENALLLSDPKKIRANREALWEALRTINDNDLATLANNYHPILQPWCELAQIQRNYQGKNVTELENAVNNWRNRYDIHPITQALIDELLIRTPRIISANLPQLAPLLKKNTIAHVGLVLPADGQAARAAVIVREGFLAAWYNAEPQSRPTVTFHPFKKGAVKAAHKAAINAGAELIIGPLTKDEVNNLTQQGELIRPTLALNYRADDELIPQLYQFGLAPTDEARQVAQQAQHDGYNRAFIITPTDDWGKRIQQAFRNQWESTGGIALSFMAADNNHEKLAALFLKLHSAQNNYRDCIFLATPPELARQLSPILRKTELPVYATSHVLFGITERDQAIVDLKLVDIPWIIDPDLTATTLRTTLEQLWPNDFINYRRIYALGVDAFRLIEALPSLENNPDTQLQGVTGILKLDDKRRIVRQGSWTKIIAGQINKI